jgi:hypothetical protein
MPADSQPVPVSKKALWAGWILTILPGLMLIASGVMKLMKPAALIEEFGRLGLMEGQAFGIGILEICCAVIYLFPRTAVLGAILVTGYLGGAVLTHLRIGDPFLPPVIVGVVAWFGLYLREPRLRALVPWRK